MIKKEQAEEAARVKIKREREHSPESLFLPHDPTPEPTTHAAAVTTVTSGPYAGLQSARKRVRNNVQPDEEEEESKATVMEGHDGENGDVKDDVKAGFGPAKKTNKKGAGLQNV